MPVGEITALAPLSARGGGGAVVVGGGGELTVVVGAAVVGAAVVDVVVVEVSRDAVGSTRVSLRPQVTKATVATTRSASRRMCPSNRP
jgi:hypothetical protein